MKTLNISSSTVHVVTKKFRESGDFFTKHCIKKGHDLVVEITAGTQDDFQESLSVEHGYDGLEVNQCPLNWQLENLGRHHQY